MKKIFTFLSVVATVALSNAQIVINEVYGGGGNSGATLINDFVELKNVGTTAVTLTGSYLQYGSAAGVFGGTGTTPNIWALPNITLQPGQTYLIMGGSGGGGTVALPTPDYTISTLNMSATTGKVALTTSATPLASATDATKLDLVGFGSANMFETAVATSPSAVNSIARSAGDSNNNSTDFAAGAPTPTNSAGVTLGVSDINTSKVNFVKKHFGR